MPNSITAIGRRGVLSGTALMTLAVFMPHSDAETSTPTFTAPCRFNNQNGDGRAPYAGLVIDRTELWTEVTEDPNVFGNSSSLEVPCANFERCALSSSFQTKCESG
jgi:hypothetical protein